MPRKIAVVAGLVAMLAACSTGGVKVDQNEISQFRVGQTTYQQVIADLGAPTSTVLSSDGTRVINYAYVHAQARAASFIPIVGLFAGGADAESQSVLFQFDARGVLSKVTSTNSHYGTGIGGAQMTTTSQ